MQYSKVTQDWVAKNTLEPTQQLPIRRDLVERVMVLRALKPLKQKQSKHPPFPRPNVAKKDRPDITVLLSRRSDRFSHQKNK